MGRQLTVTLDEELATKLEIAAERTGAPVAEFVLDTLRQRVGAPFLIDGPFVRSRPGVSFERIERLLDEVEGPTRK